MGQINKYKSKHSREDINDAIEKAKNYFSLDGKESSYLNINGECVTISRTTDGNSSGLMVSQKAITDAFLERENELITIEKEEIPRLTPQVKKQEIQYDVIQKQVGELGSKISDATTEVDSAETAIEKLDAAMRERDFLYITNNTFEDAACRATCGGQEVLDGSYCTVKRISGKTMIIFSSQLVHSSISGIKSTGSKNLINIEDFVDGSILTKDDDGYYTLTKIGGNERTEKINIFLPPGEYVAQVSGVERKEGSSCDLVFIANYMDGTSSAWSVTSFQNNFYNTHNRFHIPAPVKSIQFKIAKLPVATSSPPENGDYIKFNEFIFKPFDEKTDPRFPYAYEPYIIENQMLLPETVTLGKWDYIENGYIVRQTKTLEFTNSGDWEENDWGCYYTLSKGEKGDSNFSIADNAISDTYSSGYLNKGEIHCSGNYIYIRSLKLNEFKSNFKNFNVAYKLAEPTYEPIGFNNGYQVWEGGLEIIINDDKNAVSPTIESQYIIQKKSI